MAMTGVLRPGHAQVRVLNLEESVHFYRNVLGLVETGRDAQGRVYAVVNWEAWLALVCLDGKTGTPVGMIELPKQGGGGRMRRMFNVAPQGGLVHARATPSDVSYEWFNCQP